MKKWIKNLSTLALTLGALTLAGCSGGNDSGNTATGGYPNYNGGIVTALPNGGAQITFYGQNVAANSSYIQASTQDFNPGWPGTITLGAGGNTGGYSSLAFYGISGCTYNVGAQGSTVQLAMSQTNFNAYSVSGSVSLTPAMVQVAFGSGAIPQLIGLYVDLKFAGSSVSQGKIYFCTSRDGSGYCHGGALGIKQGVDCTY